MALTPHRSVLDWEEIFFCSFDGMLKPFVQDVATVVRDTTDSYDGDGGCMKITTDGITGAIGFASIPVPAHPEICWQTFFRPDSEWQTIGFEFNVRHPTYGDIDLIVNLMCQTGALTYWNGGAWVPIGTVTLPVWGTTKWNRIAILSDYRLRSLLVIEINGQIFKVLNPAIPVGVTALNHLDIGYHIDTADGARSTYFDRIQVWQRAKINKTYGTNPVIII